MLLNLVAFAATVTSKHDFDAKVVFGEPANCLN
jgi:hypothetical protein